MSTSAQALSLKDAVIPNTYKKLRACKTCRLIKSDDQFLKDGCDNCPDYDYGDFDSLQEHTTGNFSGTIAMMMAKESWVARWNKLGSGIPGVYAVQVNEEITLMADDGELDRRVKDDFEENDEEDYVEANGPKNLGQKRKQVDPVKAENVYARK